MKYIKILVILLIVGIISSCFRFIHIKKVDESALRISEIYLINKDSLDLKIKVINTSQDSIIFSKQYYQISFVFEDSLVYRSNISQAKIDYPISNFEKLNKTQKKIILKRLCRPLINLSEFILIPPNDSVILNYNLYENGYRGFTNGKDYKYECKIYISNSIKKLCPSIYSGILIYHNSIYR